MKFKVNYQYAGPSLNLISRSLIIEGKDAAAARAEASKVLTGKNMDFMIVSVAPWAVTGGK